MVSNPNIVAQQPNHTCGAMELGDLKCAGVPQSHANNSDSARGKTVAELIANRERWHSELSLVRQ